MIKITVKLDPRAQAVIAALGKGNERLDRAVAAAVNDENKLTVAAIMTEKLSRRGPATLGVISNRLRASIRATPAVITAGGVTASIGSNVRYAGVHEFGFEGNVRVRTHARRVTQVFGRRLRPATVAIVPAHDRRMSVPARAYIRTTLADRFPAYLAAITRAAAAILP
jgi:phage gpG-like protein